MDRSIGPGPGQSAGFPRSTGTALFRTWTSLLGSDRVRSSEGLAGASSGRREANEIGLIVMGAPPAKGWPVTRSVPALRVPLLSGSSFPKRALQLTIELEFGPFGRELSSAGHRRTHQYATMPMTHRGVL